MLKQEYGQSDEQLPTIIGLSGHTGESYQRQAKEAGMKSLEPKPLLWPRLEEIFAELGMELKDS